MRKSLLALCAAALLTACSTPQPPPPPPPPPPVKPAPAVAHFTWFTYEGNDAVYDTAKAGPRDYLNPILAGYYPDPSILRVGTDYYLVNSTFTHFPGIPVFHSRDLVHWSQIGNAIDRPGQLDFGKLEVSRGVFAPSIAFHAGTYYIVNTCVDCGGNYLIAAKDPAGPWSDPVWLPFGGIDPALFFDDNGQAYMVNNDVPQEGSQYTGHRAIWMQEFDAAAGKLIGPRRMLIDGGTDIKNKPIWIEGPHLFRKGRFYYLICAEGGTGDQHSEVVFRSNKVWGPYLSHRRNPILTQRNLNPARPFPVTSTGHAQFVATPSGQWWAVFLGTRPYADDFYNTGRETFLLPVRWKHGWPAILEPGKLVPYVQARPSLPAADAPPMTGNFLEREDFGVALAPYWLFIRTPHERWYSLSPSLDIRARPDSIGGTGQPSFIGRRQQHGWASASVEMRFAPQTDGERAGLVAFQNSNHYYFLGLVRENGKLAVCVAKRAGAGDPENGRVAASTPIALAAGAPLYLKITARGGAYDFYYGTKQGEWTALLRGADGTVLSTKTAGGFVGTVIGMYAYAPP